MRNWGARFAAHDTTMQWYQKLQYKNGNVGEYGPGSCVISKPSGTRTGDLMIVVFYSGVPVTPPSGWTLVASDVLVLYAKICTSSEPSTFFFDSGAYADAICAVYEGAHSSGVNQYGAFAAGTDVSSLLVSGFAASNPPVRVFVATLHNAFAGYYLSGYSSATCTLRNQGVNSANGQVVSLGDSLDKPSVSNLTVNFTGNVSPKGILFSARLPKSTVLHLHCDGTDGSTTFTDASETVASVTANGNAQIDTAQAKFGGASGLFDGTGDFLSIPDNWCYDLATRDFTVEGWLRLNSVAAGTRVVLGKRAAAANFGPILIYNDAATLKCSLSSNGSSHDVANGVSFATGLSTDVWYHWCVERVGSQFTGYIDGVGTALATSSAALWENAESLRIGADSASQGFNGWIDELRITRENYRYGHNFQPLGSAFVNGD